MANQGCFIYTLEFLIGPDHIYIYLLVQPDLYDPSELITRNSKPLFQVHQDQINR